MLVKIGDDSFETFIYVRSMEVDGGLFVLPVHHKPCMVSNQLSRVTNLAHTVQMTTLPSTPLVLNFFTLPATPSYSLTVLIVF